MATNRFRSILKRVIDASPLSIPRIAGKAEVSHQSIYNFLSGKSEIGTEALERIYKALNDTELKRLLRK